MKLVRKIFLLFIFGLAGFFFYEMCCGKPRDLVLGGEHATWSRSIFFRGYAGTTGEPLRQSDLEEYAKTLKDNKIKYAYIFSGPYGEEGFLPDWAFSSQAIDSVREIRRHYPEVKIVPWVGGVVGRTVHLDRETWVKNALESTKKFVEVLSVDGVHFDFEKFQGPQTYDAQGVLVDIDSSGPMFARDLIEFHKKVRVDMPNLFVSSVVVTTARDARPWKRKHTLDELKELYPLVDQISFLYYDTSIKDKDIFANGIVEQLNTIKLLQETVSHHPQVLIGIGTFINPPYLRGYRDLEIENNTNTLKALKDAMRAIPSDRRLVDGLAIYCEWQTDSEEWSEIRENWPSD